MRCLIFICLFVHCTFVHGMMPAHPSSDSIKEALIQFCDKELTLDATFNAILPEELIKKIVHYAYGKAFFDFFIAAQSLELFLDPLLLNHTCTASELEDLTLKTCIDSGKRDHKKFTYFNNPTCAYYNEKQPAMEAVCLGYSDGTIKLYPKDCEALGSELNVTTGHTASVTALTFPLHIKDGQLEPSIIAGHSDGSITSFFPRTKLNSQYNVKGEAIACINTTPTVLIALTAHHIAITSSYWDLEKLPKTITTTLFIDALGTFCDIGYKGCMLILKTEEGYYYSCTPYEDRDFKFITQGEFSPSQASIVYRVIQAGTCEIPFSAEECTLAPFVSPLMVKVLHQQKSA